MRILDALASEDQDIPCVTCGRLVKRALALEGLPGYHGLDCAARLMGRPKTRAVMDAAWLDGVKAAATRQGVAAGQVLRRQLGPRREALAQAEGRAAVWARARALAPSPFRANSVEDHAYWDGVAEGWR